MQDYQVPLDSDNGPPKPVISRGARACTVCRAAKMKCVGAEDDGAKPCQRCRRSNSECVFEKHRRGRKPGSKLSEASKMLRKIEKSSANPAKIKPMSDIQSYVPSQSSSSVSLPLLHSSQSQAQSSPRQPPPLPSTSTSSTSQSRNLFPTLTSAFPTSSSSASSTSRFPTLPVPGLHGSPPPHPSVVPQSASSSSPHVPSLSSSSSSTPAPPSHQQSQPSNQSQAQDAMEEDEEDEKYEETMYPAKMVEREGRRHNFFGTVLTNPIPKPSVTPAVSSSSSVNNVATTFRRSEEHRNKEVGSSTTSSSHPSRPLSPSSSLHHPRHPNQHYHHRHHHRHARAFSPNTTSMETHQLPPYSSSSLPSISSNNPAAAFRYFMNPRFLQNPAPIPDPVKANLLSLSQVSHLFDMIFLRLNPFINLFDPALHTPTYVREACPFLFTVLCMAGCKFFMPEKFRAVQRMAEDLCVRAFQECWKRVEVVQAFMCMTYWREPDDQRTWTFIGYAARMAVELGLNTYYYSTSPFPPPGETSELHRLQRRNRERTYLVLWVHDRSLSMQTGRQWMLPEDDLVRNAVRWYRESILLPIDTVVAAQVELRRIAASVIDIFYLHRARSTDVVPADVNYDVLLSACNTRLQVWSDDWMSALQKTNGTDFHTSFLTFFKLHVRLFLNSFGLQSSLLVHHPPSTSSSPPESRSPNPNLFALSTCYSSASDTLQLVARDFAKVDMLRYGQDSITVMTAYSAVFLLKLLRNVVQTSSLSLGENSLERVYDLINATADAYQACAKTMTIPSNSSGENGGQSSSGSPNSEEKMETDSSSATGVDATSNSLSSKHGESVSNHNYYSNNHDDPYVGTANLPATAKSTTPAFMMVFSSVEYHGRFLRTLVLKDKASRARAAEREKRSSAAVSGSSSTNTTTNNTTASASATTPTTGTNPSSNDLTRKNGHSGVSRISASSYYSSSQTSGANSNTLVVSPTTSAAATALLGGSFAGAGTRGLNGLAAVATSSASANGINGSSSSSLNSREAIMASSSTESESKNGTPTGAPYHHRVSSPYVVPSSSTPSHYHVHSQPMMNSNPHYDASQSTHSQPISAPHTGNPSANLGIAHSHRSSSFSHALPHQRGSSAQSQSHVQRLPFQQSTVMQQPYNPTVAGHPVPVWHFPASPHLPAHPLVSPEDELGPLDLQSVVGQSGGTLTMVSSNAMYNQSSALINNPANPSTGRIMNGLPDNGDASPNISGDHSNDDGGGTNAEGLPPGASAADVAYWYYMHSEMGYGNGGLHPLASVGVGVGNNGNGNMNFGIISSSIGMNMEIIGGGSLANVPSGMGNDGVGTTVGNVMNTMPGLTVPNIGSLGSVGHAPLNGMSGLSGMPTTGNNNVSDSGAGSSTEGMDPGQTSSVATASAGANQKPRASTTNASMGYQHLGIPHSQTPMHPSSHHGSHAPNHGSSSHHISSYHPHGHSNTMQNG